MIWGNPAQAVVTASYASTNMLTAKSLETFLVVIGQA